MKTYFKNFIFLFLVTLFFSFSLFAKKEPKTFQRFLYQGDGVVYLNSPKAGLKQKITYLKPDGSVDSQALPKLNKFFMVPQNLGESIDWRLIALIDHLEDKYQPQAAVHLTSVYRSPKYNQALIQKGRTVAKTSYHQQAMAADMIFSGIHAKTIWEYTRGLEAFGVGYYGAKIVHLDSGKPRFWDQTTAIPAKNKIAHNANVYLSHTFDFYKPKEALRLYLSAIAVYPIFVRPEVKLLDNEKNIVTSLNLTHSKLKVNENHCYAVNKRMDGRLFSVTLPKKIKKKFAGPYVLEMEFCEPFDDQLPQKILSRPLDFL